MADFAVEILGTVWLFHAQSVEAKALIDDRVLQLEGWQRLGSYSFAADHRPAGYLAEALCEDGYSLERR